MSSFSLAGYEFTLNSTTVRDGIRPRNSAIVEKAVFASGRKTLRWVY